MSKLNDYLNPESAPRRQDISKTLERIFAARITENDHEITAVRTARLASNADDKDRRDVGTEFGKRWDPLKEMGIVRTSEIRETEEIVQDMTRDPIESLRNPINERLNQQYVAAISDPLQTELGSQIQDSFLDKEVALQRVGEIYASMEVQTSSVDSASIKV